MCEIWEEVRREGIELGIERGIEQGIEQGEKTGRFKEQLSSIRNLMETLDLTAQQAMDALKIPSEKRDGYIAQL